VVVGFTEFERDGSTRQYYDIELIGESSSSLMVPVARAKEVGLRRVVSRTRLKRKVWPLLRSSPKPLADDHKARYSRLGAKLQEGAILSVAEALRDLAGRLHERRSLTAKEKRLYDRAMTLLAAEVAAVQSTDIEEAETQISTLLQKSHSS